MKTGSVRKPTPGRWKSIDNEILIEETGQTIARAAMSGGFPKVRIPEYRANARIMAAGPVMLDALRKARLALLLCYDPSEPHQPTNRSIGDTLTAIDWAIELAEGRVA